MNQLIHLVILIPLVGFLISLLIPKNREALLARTAITIAGVHLISSLVLIIAWCLHDFETLNIKDLVVVKQKNYEFYIDFYFDKITSAFLLTGALLTFLIVVYSRYYMHREPGYKRFFSTILFFYFGYVLTVFSGNLETLFIGWEILGISSFLLIGFYRNRFLPVKNALKVFSLYRIGDVGLILAMWLSHHLWHQNISFARLNNYDLVHHELQSHSITGTAISLLFLITAAVKSAQFPFSSWLPRAMEGPTPSSAIFYGSLSVHIGAFLLLRTFPFWEQQLSVRIIIVVAGLVTTFIAYFTSRVQSSVKSQIAYSSIAQIGLIFIEIALGFTNVALIHFSGNAFFRSYQLLISPSVVSYLIKEQLYFSVTKKKKRKTILPKKMADTLFVLSLQEWNLDNLINRMIFRPIKKAGKLLRKIPNKFLYAAAGLIFTVGLTLTQFQLTEQTRTVLSPAFALIGLFLVIRSFVERKNALNSWFMILFNHFWILLAAGLNEHFGMKETMIYASGIIAAGVFGYIILRKLIKREGMQDLDKFKGHSYEYPGLALAFLIACLGITGFPITTTFIGEDLVFTHIHENQIFLAAFCSLSLILDGISVMRVYSKIFLGPHIKTYHESAYRSS